MIDRRYLVLLARGITAPLPRIKGLGLGIAYIGRFFRRWDVVVDVPVLGNRMKLNTADLIGNLLIFAPNYYDRRERKWIRSIVRPGDFVVDVGANIGAYALQLTRLVTKAGKVIAIEARATQCRYLESECGDERHGLGFRPTMRCVR